ncbi:hypothetical protein BHE74_00045524 [Ensete ventricosum]|nr:hypothetical protein GW17_00052801 [Ensete ventricosum]RWW48400.1 hypothetical protein BHE74_00045524 [Ensete ventricosum]
MLSYDSKEIVAEGNCNGRSNCDGDLFSCRRRLWWEQAPNDAGNGSSLMVGAGAVDSDVEAAVVAGQQSGEIGKAVFGGAATKERDDDRMKASPLRDGRIGSDDRDSYGGGGKAAVSPLLCSRLYGRLWQLLHAIGRDGTQGAGGKDR